MQDGDLLQIILRDVALLEGQDNGEGMGTRGLAALRRNRDQPPPLAPEQLADDWAVGGVFDQHRVGPQTRPLQ